MLLTLEILLNKYAPDKLQSTLSHSSQATDLFAKLILADISSDNDLNSLNPLTAELAAYAASTTNFPEHKDLLMAIAETDKLKTPGTLCIAGKSVIESNPGKAIELLMESGDLQLRQKEPLLISTPEQPLNMPPGLPTTASLKIMSIAISQSPLSIITPISPQIKWAKRCSIFMVKFYSTAAKLRRPPKFSRNFPMSPNPFGVIKQHLNF